MLVKTGVEKLGRMNDVSVKYLKKGREGERGIFFLSAVNLSAVRKCTTRWAACLHRMCAHIHTHKRRM